MNKKISHSGYLGQTHLYSMSKEVEVRVGAGCSPPERLHGDILDSRSFMIALGTSDHSCMNCRMLSKVQRRFKPALAGSSVPQPRDQCLSRRQSPRLHSGIPRNWRALLLLLHCQLSRVPRICPLSGFSIIHSNDPKIPVKVVCGSALILKLPNYSEPLAVCYRHGNCFTYADSCHSTDFQKTREPVLCSRTMPVVVNIRGV